MSARDPYLVILSHELRTPLNAIKSWTHVLENELGGADPLVRRALAGILAGIEQQVRLLDRLLDASRSGTAAELEGHPDYQPEDSMASGGVNKGNADEDDRKRDRAEEHPTRPETEPDTMQGPGGAHERKGEEESRNKTTRRGEP